MPIALTDAQISALEAYLELFIKWNKAYNLSAIRDPEEMVTKHLLDSLSIAHLLEGERFIDVGTGGGLPGIPLAITYPNKHFTLLDSAGKKTRFLFQVKQALGLDNVEIENRRVEAFKPEPLFEGVISRAFASLKDMIDNCQHLIKENGKFWAMKGVFPDHELSELEKHYMVDASHALQVPGLEEQRCLIVLSRKNIQ
ncbi:16S rRNA (guanine(527)-N(7))-methyltransferase RsmG [Teredinibacter franksiae]|uniref:16S rRNA (guanine(527)-N(7))-methyltransferase RsmG n=1 Tax=Teredinibacter franksiae TaxID=2761453 RepID=UPI001C89544F|nr:16S rRNA (guanine(527)-N(7))-methyltransferase RsmG [Teredinibacter franksiae]